MFFEPPVYIISVELFSAVLLMSLSQSFARDLQLHRILDPKTFEAFIYVPMVNESKERRFPLLLFLHGGCQSGEGGPELERLIYDSTAPLLDLAQGTAIPSFARRFVVVAPQSRWEEFTKPHENQTVKKLICFLGFLLHSDFPGRHIDASRLFVTGHSNGAYAALAVATTKQFDAVVQLHLRSCQTQLQNDFLIYLCGHFMQRTILLHRTTKPKSSCTTYEKWEPQQMKQS
eukprot:gnl/MRDRNA2_/MRDRNA2_55998_c0_seq1.p1 gnl/MRDRNA2_/MRDRNA2_55998_c0~~gnl/MRDRNA2_/MRDRNA2_55998_c0_seq1.p1  ORF type:complete len:231 (+),score=21.72 gnl/MRDRNA2_/MRDRNA2_55998_c0_seq1:173-865(+)